MNFLIKLMIFLTFSLPSIYANEPAEQAVSFVDCVNFVAKTPGATWESFIDVPSVFERGIKNFLQNDCQGIKDGYFYELLAGHGMSQARVKELLPSYHKILMDNLMRQNALIEEPDERIKCSPENLLDFSTKENLENTLKGSKTYQLNYDARQCDFGIKFLLDYTQANDLPIQVIESCYKIKDEKPDVLVIKAEVNDDFLKSSLNQKKAMIAIALQDRSDTAKSIESAFGIAQDQTKASMFWKAHQISMGINALVSNPDLDYEDLIIDKKNLQPEKADVVYYAFKAAHLLMQANEFRQLVQDIG